MVAITYQGPTLELPWSAGEQEESRFNRLLKQFGIAFIVLSVAVSFIPVPEQAREEQEKLPENLARLLLEEQAIPEPVIEGPVYEEPVIEQVQDIPEEILNTPPEIVEVEPEHAPQTELAPAQVVEAARERASVSGLLQFQDNLADMRDRIDVDFVTSHELVHIEAEATEVSRDLLNSRAAAESGGVQVADVSVDAGGVAYSGKENTVIESGLSLPSGLGADVVYAQTDDGSQGLPYRSEEEMRRVMDANKSAIFAVYHRALRTDPTLEGKLTIAMEIEPSGFVSLVTLIDNQLADLDLVNKLLRRIELIQFPSGEYALTTLNQTFDFLPY